MTWSFAAGDAQTVKLWSEAVQRDAEKMQFFTPGMYSLDNPKNVKHPDGGKATGIIRVHNDFASKSGDRLTLHNIARVTGRGVHGDGLLKDAGANLTTYTMNLFYENVAMQVFSDGELSERRTVMNFRQNARAELAAWAARKTEEAIVLGLFGLTTWNASGPQFDNWSNNGESQVFLNTIQAFDSDHIVYAGDATSAATVDSADRMTAQLLTKLETKALEELSIPLEPLRIDGEDCFVLLLSAKGCEDLRYDSDWVNAQRGNAQSPSNPLLKRAIGKYGMIYVVPYPKCPWVAANVSRAILCGKDALHMAKVEEWSWYEDFLDTRKRRKAVSIGAFLGMAPTYFNGTRRNALAVDHYVRS